MARRHKARAERRQGQPSRNAIAAALTLTLLAMLLSASAAIAVPNPLPAPSAPRDAELYAAIAQRTAETGDYYAAATELQRSSGYPLRPFVAVRLPSVSWLYGAIGPAAMLALAWSLGLLNVLAWQIRLRGEALPRRMVAALVTAIPLIAISPPSVLFGDLWCGLLLGLAFAAHSMPLRLGTMAAALCFREFALIAIAAEALFALTQRRRGRALAAVAVALAGCVMLALHAQAVLAHTAPTDAFSPGWLGLRGLGAPGADLAQLLGIEPALAPLLALGLFLPLLGWLHWRDWSALLWFGGFMLLICGFARADNFYWLLNLLPAYLVGIALIGLERRRSGSG